MAFDWPGSEKDIWVRNFLLALLAHPAGLYYRMRNPSEVREDFRPFGKKQTHSQKASLSQDRFAKKRLRSVSFWLFGIAALVFLMVLVGGATRLTRSGLSIVEWKPVTGVLPPLNEKEWQLEFEKYKQFPEYKILNHHMDLEEFKGIFFWEYFHRLLGRLIGLAFFAPFLYFYFRGFLKGLGARSFVAMFVLGGLQGALGWFMVKSGLVKDPHVSHYRLAAHLLLAFFVYSYIFYAALRIWNMESQQSWSFLGDLRLYLAKQKFWPGGLGFLGIGFGLLLIQIFYGALTAGLKAGLLANTFPDVNGAFIPQGLFFCKGCPPFWQMAFESPLTVQFLHRSFAWLLLFYVFFLVFFLKEKLRESKLLWGLGLWTIGQFLLGVFTLLLQVPVFLGVLHQGGALLLLSLFLLVLYHLLSNAKEKDAKMCKPERNGTH